MHKRDVLRQPVVWMACVALGVAAEATGQASATAVPAAQQVDRYVVGRALPPEVPGSDRADMTLEQAMEMALEKNLDLKAARMNPQSVDYQLQSARAAFLPRYSSTYNYQTSTTPSNNTLDGVANVTSGTQQFNASVNQLLPWFGASLGANFTNNRQSTNNRTARLNPAFNSRLNLSYSQPLLAGFRMDNTRNQLRTLAIQRQVVDVQLQATIENTRAAVRTAYWNLRQAIEQIEIQRRALQLAQQLFEDNKVKVEIGTLAPIETTQSETAVANAEQALLAAEVGWRTAELNFKRLLASGPNDDIYRATINPVEQPTLTVESVDIPTAVQTALEQRTDLVQSRRSIDVSQLNLEVTRNLTRPQLDLQAGYNTSGQGGTRLQDGNVISQGGYQDALRALGTFDTAGWNVGLTFALPFGRDISVNRANYARQLLALEQAQVELQAQELTVSADVTNAGLNVENTYKQFQAAQKAREAQERNTEAAQVRFDVGMATNFEVVQAQQNLTTARLSELRALINYMNAVAEFDRIQRVGR